MKRCKSQKARRGAEDHQKPHKPIGSRKAKKPTGQKAKKPKSQEAKKPKAKQEKKSNPPSCSGAKKARNDNFRKDSQLSSTFTLLSTMFEGCSPLNVAPPLESPWPPRSRERRENAAGCCQAPPGPLVFCRSRTRKSSPSGKE